MTLTVYDPSAWVLVEMNTPEDGRFFRLLCSYYGGYLGGDEWRMCSAIQYSIDYDTYYSVVSQSGNQYSISKHLTAYRMSALTSSVWARMLTALKEHHPSATARIYEWEEALAHMESIKRNDLKVDEFVDE